MAIVPTTDEVINRVKEVQAGIDADRAGLEKVSVRQEILETALKCVVKDRNASYGSPEDNFERICNLWGDCVFGFRPTMSQHALTMILVKVARLLESPAHMDSWTDIAGYAACGGEVAQTEQDRNVVGSAAPAMTPEFLEQMSKLFGDASTALRNGDEANPIIGEVMDLAKSASAVSLFAELGDLG